MDEASDEYSDSISNSEDEKTSEISYLANHYSIPFGLQSYIAESSGNASTFLDIQTDLSENTRLSVIDWLYRIVSKIGIYKSILFNAVAIINHFLSKKKIGKQSFQMLAATALWVSCKIDGSKYSDFRFFCALCQNQFSLEDFCSTELQIIETLDGVLHYPTAQSFFPSVLSLANQKTSENWCQFFLDISLTDVDFVNTPPQITAAAAILDGCLGNNLEIFFGGILYSIDCSDPEEVFKVAKALLNVARTIVENKVGGFFTEIEAFAPGQAEKVIARASDRLRRMESK